MLHNQDAKSIGLRNCDVSFANGELHRANFMSDEVRRWRTKRRN